MAVSRFKTRYGCPKCCGHSDIAKLVGAAKGLGGFFPPIGLGITQDLLGSYAGGFLLLSGFSLLCLVILKQTSFRTVDSRY